MDTLSTGEMKQAKGENTIRTNIACIAGLFHGRIFLRIAGFGHFVENIPWIAHFSII